MSNRQVTAGLTDDLRLKLYAEHIECRVGALSALPSLLDKLNIQTPLIVTGLSMSHCIAASLVTHTSHKGNSLNTKTDVIKQISSQIESSGRKVAGVHSKIGEHAPIAGIHEGLELLKKYAKEGEEVGLSRFLRSASG